MDRIPPLLTTRRRLFGPLALMALTISIAAIVFFFDPTKHAFYPICYFHLVTGFHCPGCGATRALHALLHGHIAAAARQNLLFLLCLPVAAGIAGHRVLTWLYGQSVAFSVRPVWLWTFLAVSAAFTIIRNLPGFEWLVP